MAQIFGALPVSGLSSANVQDVYFRWRRLKVLLAGVVIGGASLETALNVYRAVKVGMDMDAAGLVFRCVTIYI